jgi:hypothetical protein
VRRAIVPPANSNMKLPRTIGLAVAVSLVPSTVAALTQIAERLQPARLRPYAPKFQQSCWGRRRAIPEETLCF